MEDEFDTHNKIQYIVKCPCNKDIKMNFTYVSI